MGWAESGKAKAYKPPVRLGFMYMPHGVIMDQFWPKTPESFRNSPPPALESLRPEVLREFQRGNLFNDPARRRRGPRGLASG